MPSRGPARPGSSRRRHERPGGARPPCRRSSWAMPVVPTGDRCRPARIPGIVRSSARCSRPRSPITAPGRSAPTTMRRRRPGIRRSIPRPHRRQARSDEPSGRTAEGADAGRVDAQIVRVSADPHDRSASILDRGRIGPSGEQAIVDREGGVPVVDEGEGQGGQISSLSVRPSPAVDQDHRRMDLSILGEIRRGTGRPPVHRVEDVGPKERGPVSRPWLHDRHRRGHRDRDQRDRSAPTPVTRSRASRTISSRHDVRRYRCRPGLGSLAAVAGRVRC